MVLLRKNHRRLTFVEETDVSKQQMLRERDFEKVGGLKEHIQTLKEMIIYPLMYRELFEAHGIEAPRGVLFHGPPGTGKTLMAGAVAAECSKSTNRRVAFYVRKGADCLNKYVGESEKHLQNLFTQAQNTRPSIIFFDEIDGLVPTRSEAQEQVHASVVSTLLALMDGLDSKSEVFVIGATNRIDMIDPALRRPGRFDRELYFPLPPLEARVQIFQIHTKNWRTKPKSEFLVKLASECAGYCGADIQSLCSQAVMESFRRSFPEVVDTTKRLQINIDNVHVEKEDFWAAKEKFVPASQRILCVPARPLTPEIEPLLQRSLQECLDFILKTCPFKFLHRNKKEFSKNKSITCPRVMLARDRDQGHIPYLASAILHKFDHLPVTIIDLPTINDQNVRGSETSSLIQKVKQARQSMPGIIYFPDIGSWWELLDETGRMVLINSLEKLDSSACTRLLFLATSNTLDYTELSSDIRKIFPKNKTILVKGPMKEEKTKFFNQLLLEKTYIPPYPHPTTKKEHELKYEYEIGDKWENQMRRSRRQKGLDVEYLGIAFDSKPKINSYYRRYINETCKFLENKNVDTCKRALQIDSFDSRPNKKLKPDLWDIPSSSKDTEECTNRSTNDLINVSKIKMEELVKLCVQITLNTFTDSVIKLYEQLEIVMLRFASSWDRSCMPQELEREISLFSPS